MSDTRPKQGDNDVVLLRKILQQLRGEADSSSPITVSVDPASSVGISDGPNLDAFSRLRVSEPTTLFSSQAQYSTQPALYEGGASGTGVAPAHNANARMVDLVVAAGTGTSYYQSYNYHPYQPGKSHCVLLTFVLGAAVANVTKQIGYFDSLNGIYLEQDGTNGLNLVRRTSVTGSTVNNPVAQASWNLDPLDGTGPSGITLDITKSQIMVIDLQFLGMGRIRVGFDIGGVIVYAHQFLNANTTLDVPYMQSATLPVGALVTAASSAAPATLRWKCAAVISEGGFDIDPTAVNSSGEGTATAGSGTRTHILSLRPATTFNGIVNRVRMVLDDVHILAGTNPVFWELCVGATFSAAPTWAAISSTYSAFERGTGGTFQDLTTAGGTVITSGYVASSASARGSVADAIAANWPITLNRAGAQRALGTLTLLVTGIGGTSASRAAINFFEVR